MRRRTLTALGVGVLLTVSLVAASGATLGEGMTGGDTAGDWDQRRADAGSSGAVADDGPRGPYATTRWTRDGGEPGVSPVVSNGTVFTGHSTIYGYRQYEGAVAAVNESSGATEWNRTDLGAVERLAVADGTVYVHTTYWNESEDINGQPAERVVALDATTGETVWRYNLTGIQQSPLLVANGTLYLGTVALDADSGDVRWRDANFSVHAVANGTLYGTYGAERTDDGWLYGIVAADATDRSVEWRWTGDTSVGAYAAANGSVYATLGNNRTVALDAANGSVRWERTVDAPFQNSTSEWISAPAVADGHVYVTTDDDMPEEGRDERVSAVHALDTSDGSVAWRFQTLATLRSAPAVTNGSVYVGGYYPSEGGYEQSRDMYRTTVNTAAEVGDWASSVVGYGLNATTGAERWSYATVPMEPGPYGYLSVVADDGLALFTHGEEQAPPNDDSLDTIVAVEESETAPGADGRVANDTPTALPENQPPEVTVTTDPANATEEGVHLGSNVTLTADASDPDGEVRDVSWRVNGGEETAGNTTTFRVPVCEPYRATVTVRDDDGAETTRNVTVEVTACAPRTNGTGEDWSQLRSGADRDGAIADDGPGGPSVETRWSHQGGEADVSPVVVNGTVYAGYTTYYEYNRMEGAVKAINEESGLVRWHRTDLGSVESVATDGERIFVTTNTVNHTNVGPYTESYVRALDAATGETLWSRNVSGELVVANGTLYAHNAALDPATGETLWSDANVTVGAATEGTLYADTGNGVTAWDASDRSVEWTWTGDAQVRGFAVDDGSVYATLGNNRTVALDAANGSVRWERTVDASFQNSTSEWISAPAVADGHVYVTTDDDMPEEGRDERVSAVHALNASDGSVAWRFQTLATLRSAPVVANGSVYVGGYYPSEGGYEQYRDMSYTTVDTAAEVGDWASSVVGYGLNATTGAERWSYATVLMEPGPYGYLSVVADDGLALFTHGEERAPPYDDSLDTIVAVEESETAPGADGRVANDTPTAYPDNDPPTVTVETDPANATEESLPAGTNVTLTANASDPDGEIVGYEWWVDGDPVEDAAESITVTVSECYDREVRVRVVDDDGDSDSTMVVVQDGT